ncbi:MAG: NCS2 family permease, partial [Spirochaetes bacterium]|nr:NCS2 family permease [Spirochaetota bacterium]
MLYNKIMVTLQDVLAAIGVVLNGIPMMIFAMSFGFMTVPTAIGYIIAAAGMLLYGAITPVSIQAGTIALVGTMGRSLSERLSIALYSGLIMALVGAIGLIHNIMGFAGARVIFAMQAGVGIILARVAFDMIKANKFVGIVSMASALLVYIPTQNLIYTVVVSVIASSGASFLKNKAPANTDSEKYKFKLYKPVLNYNVVRGALALVCLTIGSNIAFGNITAG